MNLKSFGCSFIFGSELADDGRDGPYATPSQLSWPALYAKELGYGYQCLARPGSGNLQIAERCLSSLACTSERTLYVIGWTWIDRFDYTNSENDRWQTIMPIDTGALAKTYYKDIHSQYRDKLTTLMSIKLVVDTLKEKQHPFIMTYMDDLMFESKWHTTPAITAMQDAIKPYMTQFDNLSFLQWSRKNKFAETAMWHPLEEAHAAAAAYISQLGVYKV